MTSTVRVLLGFAVVGTTILGGSFRHVRAQPVGDAGTTSEPALQLVALDSTGVVFTLIPSPTADGYTLEEIETRVKRAKIGLGVSVVVMVGGSVLFLYGAAADDTAAAATGLILSLGGTGGTIASGILLRRRKRDRNRLLEAHYGTPRRVQWDLAQSRLLF
jgi:drug/metabolite transporter (DMT)-like permease